MAYHFFNFTYKEKWVISRHSCLSREVIKYSYPKTQNTGWRKTNKQANKNPAFHLLTLSPSQWTNQPVKARWMSKNIERLFMKTFKCVVTDCVNIVQVNFTPKTTNSLFLKKKENNWLDSISLGHCKAFKEDKAWLKSCRSCTREGESLCSLEIIDWNPNPEMMALAD